MQSFKCDKLGLLYRISLEGIYFKPHFCNKLSLIKSDSCKFYITFARFLFLSFILRGFMRANLFDAFLMPQWEVVNCRRLKVAKTNKKEKFLFQFIIYPHFVSSDLSWALILHLLTSTLFVCFFFLKNTLSRRGLTRQIAPIWQSFWFKWMALGNSA